MTNLILREMRQLWSRGLTRALLALTIGFSVFFWLVQPLPPSPEKADGPLLAVSSLTDYQPVPTEREAYDQTLTLVEAAVRIDEDSRTGSLPLYGAAGLLYQSFQLTQSGLLILGSLVLGLAALPLKESPLLRQVGSTRLLIARAAALTISCALIFLLPKLILAAVAIRIQGPDSLAANVLFNPKAGPLLYHFSEGSYIAVSDSQLSLANRVTTLGLAFVSAGLYELFQLFVWSSLGLLLGSLVQRRFSVVAMVVTWVALARTTIMPFNHLAPAHFFFPLYQDALRDTLGSLDNRSGMLTGIWPLDHSLGLAVMLLSGLLLLYLYDLQLKGRLRLRRRGGDEDELA